MVNAGKSAGSIWVVGAVCLAIVLAQGCSTGKPQVERAAQDGETARSQRVTPTSHQRAQMGAAGLGAAGLGAAGAPPLLLSGPQASLPRPPHLSQPLQNTAAGIPAGVAQAPLDLASTAVQAAEVDTPPPGFILPSAVFGAGAGTGAIASPFAVAGVGTVAMSRAPAPEIRIYASPTTQAYFARAGLEYQRHLGTWEGFLRRYQIPFSLVTGPEGLEQAASGVLLLPSAVALSERERRAIAQFRERGGSVLATWLAGVRNESGAFTGFDFMDNVLDAKVAGNNELDADDNYLMPYGDNPLLSSLPAGQRVWMERLKEWYPLRMKGMQEAAQLMDWSRTVHPGKPNAAIVFSERSQTGGRTSRAAVLGYPERIWISSDPKSMDSIARDTLTWLLRQPRAYVAAWPYPYTHALALAVDAPDEMDERDLELARKLEALGGKASFFVLSEHAAQSQPVLKALQQRGHEVAYMGDRFAGFKDQPLDQQASRLSIMKEEMQKAGIETSPAPGFHPPMDSYDKSTVQLLAERRMGYLIADAGGSEARLPYIAGGAMLGLPRTVPGIEDALPPGSPATAVNAYLAELDMSAAMGGLAVFTTPSHSKLAANDWNRIFDYIRQKQKTQWLASPAQVANWWRERERVSVRMDASVVPAQLTVEVKGEGPLRQPVNVLANLPGRNATLRLAAGSGTMVMPRVVRFDEWRSAVVLDGLAPGAYAWHVYFDKAADGGATEGRAAGASRK